MEFRRAERVAILDNRIISAHAPLLCQTRVCDRIIAKNHAIQNHTKYDRAAEDVVGRLHLNVQLKEFYVKNMQHSIKEQLSHYP